MKLRIPVATKLKTSWLFELRTISTRGLVYLTSLSFIVNPGEAVHVQWNGFRRVLCRSDDAHINNELYRSYANCRASSDIMHYLSQVVFRRVKACKLVRLPDGGA